MLLGHTKPSRVHSHPPLCSSVTESNHVILVHWCVAGFLVLLVLDLSAFTLDIDTVT